MNEIEFYLATLLPAIMSVIFMAAAVIKMMLAVKRILQEFGQLKDSVNETTNVLRLEKKIDEVQKMNQAVLEENIQLKKQMNKIIDEQNKIYREGDGNEQDNKAV